MAAVVANYLLILQQYARRFIIIKHPHHLCSLDAESGAYPNSS